MSEPIYVLPAELVGMADAPGGILNIGGVEVQAHRLVQRDPEDDDGKVAVYVRRLSSDLAVAQIVMSGDDSLEMEAMGAQTDIVDDLDPSTFGDEVEDVLRGSSRPLAAIVQDHATLVAKWAGAWAIGIMPDDPSPDVHAAFRRVGALLDEACEILSELGGGDR